MRAADVMNRNVIAIDPEDPVQAVARVLWKHRISGAPVVNKAGVIIGIVTESDLMRRSEIGTDERRSWWSRTWVGRERLARDYVRAHGRKVTDVMTSHVITAGPNVSLRDVASLMEKNAIKRVPIVDGGKLVGIVSRADLLRAFATFYVAPTDEAASDEEIRSRIYLRLRSQHWISPNMLNVVVDGGVVELWAAVNSEAERKAICVAAETTPGVTAVKDHVMIGPIPSAY